MVCRSKRLGNIMQEKANIFYCLKYLNMVYLNGL